MWRTLLGTVVLCSGCTVALPHIADAPPVDGAVGDAMAADNLVPCGDCTPPAAGCEEDTRVYYETTGCADGECQFAVQREVCEHGCREGRCLQCVGHVDDFASLDPALWRSWAADDIALEVRDGALRAQRASKLTAEWGLSAGVALAPRVDFSGNGASITWVVQLHDDAVWTRIYAAVLDKDAKRMLAFDYGVDGVGAVPGFIFRLSFTAPFEHHWQRAIDLPPAPGKTVRFVLSNPSPRTATFEAYDESGGVLASQTKTFDAPAWNGIDWVEVQWYATGWPFEGAASSGGEPNVVHASLHELSTSCSIDAQPPRIELGGAPPDTPYAEDLEISVGAADAESGVRCVRASWEGWPADDGTCAETSLTTQHPATGERTLHVRAWDWGGNRTEQQATYHRTP